MGQPVFRDSATIVSDHQPNGLLLFLQFDQHGSGAGMAHHIRQRFLANSKYGGRLLRFEFQLLVAERASADNPPKD